jgi:hypothetical protein
VKPSFHGGYTPIPLSPPQICELYRTLPTDVDKPGQK